MRNEPDGVLGAVMAAESIQGFSALLNSPGGCRSRLQSLMKSCCAQELDSGGANLGSRFYGRIRTVPCTYLNGRDMVLGSGDRIREAIAAVREGSREPVFIDTLSASLQVTDDRGICRETGTISAGEGLSSMTFGQGYDSAMRAVLESLADRDAERVGGRVNVLGYGISDRGWEYGKRWLEDMLGRCGASDVRFIGCGCTRRDIEEAGSAELNILIHPECCASSADALRGMFGTETLVPSMGSPVGYPATIGLLEETADRLDADASDAVEAVRSDMRDVNGILTRNSALIRTLRGCSFSVRGMVSDILPICRWMLDELSMLPGSLSVMDVPDEGQMRSLRSFLEETDCTDSLEGRDDPLCSVRFTDGMQARLGQAEDNEDVYIPAFMPFADNTGLVDRSLIGTNGCRWMLDTLINDIEVHVCGQPRMSERSRTDF